MEQNFIEFYILTYNNTFCAEYQIKTIRAFCKDDFKITIIDSNCGEFENQSKELYDLCTNEDIELLKMPNEYKLDNLIGSYRLGHKLNYLFEHLVKKRKPKYFAFIDQDMFMFKDFKIIHFLDKYGMWGDVDEPNNHKSPSIYKKDMIDELWHMHPWLLFFKLDFVINENLNFIPDDTNGGTDTGGSLRESLIQKKQLNKKDYWFRDNIVYLFPFKSISNAGPPPYEDHYYLYNNKVYYGQIQINNEFIHMLNSHSNLLDPKVAYIKGFLDHAIINNS